ncbi:MAG: hypothetical protein AB7K35_02540 [Pseudorhodoplanes sp.]
MQLAAKWAILALVVAVLGLPINQIFPFVIALVAAVIVFFGNPVMRARSWFAALAVALVAIAGQYALNPDRIDEGHNVFLVEGRDNALVTGLPPDVYRLMAAEFEKVHPAEKRCDANAEGCWLRGGFPSRSYAFSADGLLDAAPLSRRVAGINFSDPIWLRLGFINDARYNWISEVSDIDRFKRDRRFWMGLQRWQLTMPYFVMYRFPAAFAGSDLCWMGTAIWEDRNDQFSLLTNSRWACRAIEAADVGKRIYGLGFRPGSLAMALEPPVTLVLRQALAAGLMVFGAVTILGLLTRWRARQVLLPATLIGLAFVVIGIDDAAFIGGWRPLDSGDDGLWYESVARGIVQNLFAGNILEALRGSESVFYYGGPGLRYLRAFERIVFGDSNLGYLSLMLLLPLVVFALYRRFLPGRWALALALIFVAVPVGALFGTTYFQYAKWAARGFADPAACLFAMTGTLFLVGVTRLGPGARFAPALAAGLLLALAVFVRPNIAPFVGIVLGGAGLAALLQRQWLRLIGLCLGFVPVLAMPLHNWYFGNAFVLFSANAAHPQILVMPPSAYVAVAGDLLRLDLFGEHVPRALRHLVQWLAGPSEMAVMAPLNLLAIVLVVYVVARARFDSWLRLVGAAALGQLAVGLFYIGSDRYHLLGWFFAGLVTLVWLQAEGLPLLRYRYPGWWERAARQPVSRGLEIALRRFQKLAGVRDRGIWQAAR